jgi:hypothetical protein
MGAAARKGGNSVTTSPARARLLFSEEVTTMPAVIRTAESVLLTCWPPAPLER